MIDLTVTEKDKMINDLMFAMDYTIDEGNEEWPTEVTINYDSIADELLKRGWHKD